MQSWPFEQQIQIVKFVDFWLLIILVQGWATYGPQDRIWPAKGIFVAREMIESYYKNVYFFGKDDCPSGSRYWFLAIEIS